MTSAPYAFGDRIIARYIDVDGKPRWAPARILDCDRADSNDRPWRLRFEYTTRDDFGRNRTHIGRAYVDHDGTGPAVKSDTRQLLPA